MDIRAFITHKKAETFSDCQDRFSINSDTKSVAVSDGMSQSFFQKIWAEILVDAFVDNSQWNLCGEQCKEILKELQSKWLEKVLDRIEEQKHDGTKENIIYRNEKFVAQGKSAGATLVGVRFAGANWYCQVLGDSCLIEIKDGEIVQICTSQEGDEFDNFPDHFDSNPKQSGKGNAKEFKGTLETDSVLLLVSDPFSDFLNEQRKKGECQGTC
jgi:serine/threonine protein phosphatase PrpC